MSEEELENQQQKRDAQAANTDDSDEIGWMVAPGYVLKEQFGFTAENRPIIKLNPENIPEELRTLIPYAEEWGVHDDLIRADVIRKASPIALRDFVFVIKGYDDTINKWLGGPEAYLNEHSDEYYTFSAMMMAYDEARYSL